MATEKAAVFVDNSNIFFGMKSFSRYLMGKSRLRPEQYIRIRWDKLVQFLETQNGGLDLFVRRGRTTISFCGGIGYVYFRP